MISYKKISGYNKNKEGVKCMICNHCYFKYKFNYPPNVSNDCHDFSVTVMDLSNFYTLTIIEYILVILIKKKLRLFLKNQYWMIKVYYEWILNLILVQ